MKTLIIAAAAASIAGAAMAQAPAPQAPAAGAPAAAAPAAGAKLSVKTTPIGEIIKNPAAKAVLEKALPEISQYYEMIGSNTLTEIIAMSGGAVTEAQVAAIQVEFDKL